MRCYFALGVAMRQVGGVTLNKPAGSIFAKTAQMRLLINRLVLLQWVNMLWLPYISVLMTLSSGI